MKIIFKIARAELRTLFYSPIAWLVIILFYATGAALFSYSMEGLSTYQEVMLDLQPDWFGFSNGAGNFITTAILNKTSEYIFLFIPLLTMGVINRELSNGTIKLLYSSPIRTREIVLGKYLGLVLFSFILLLIFIILLLLLYVNIQNGEYELYFAILLGLFLLMNTYFAIGLFISCLTTYQIVAAVITFTVFFILSAISGLWQQYDLIRDITWLLSMAGRSEMMLYGLITSRDVLYFILIIALFIGFAMIRLRSTQESRKWTVAASRYGALLLIVIILGYVSSRPGYIAYADLTNNKTNTLHPATQEVLKQLDGAPLTVTLFTNLLDQKAIHGLPQNRNKYLWGFWEPFIRFYPNIELKYEYYYDINEGDRYFFNKYPGKSIEEIVAIEAEVLDIRQSIFKKPAEMEKLVDFSGEDKSLIMQLEYKGKKEFLRTYLNSVPWPGQEQFSGTIKRLVRAREPKVSFVTGHYERSAVNSLGDSYLGHTNSIFGRTALINNGVDTDTISLVKEEIPTDLDLLVVADPRSAYNKQEQEKMIAYLNNGGNAILYAETGKQFILEPMLKSIGVHPDNGIIVSPNKHEMPHIFHNRLNKAGNFLAKEPDLELFQLYGLVGGRVQNEGALNLSYEAINGFTVEPVMAQPGNNRTWIENGILVVDSAAPIYAAAEGDIQKNEYVIALKLTRKINNKEQRIIVAGDADFMGGGRWNNNTINVAFYSWALYNEYPVYANFPLANDRFLTVSSAKAKVMIYVYVYLASAILLFTAIILLVRRKRK